MAIIRDAREFPPPVGVIFQQAVQVAMDNAGVPVITAEEAFRWIRSPDWYAGGPHPDAPIAVREAAETVGWDRVCHDPNVAATFAHFTRVFNIMQKRQVRNAIETLVGGGQLDFHEGEALINAMPLDDGRDDDGQDDE